MKNILCFGDSNTYGYIPGGRGRYDQNKRWTGILEKKLGDKYRIIEEGLCGRTTVFNDELRSNRRGIDSIGMIVESHNPIDVLIIMLGTNDCKTRYSASASIIAKGMEEVINIALEKAKNKPEVLVISPIILGKDIGDEEFDPEFNSNSEKTSQGLDKEFEKMAVKNGYYYLNAADYAVASEIDREHLDEEGHRKLADAIYIKLKSIF